jgi:diguanylate cyclase (GGDEF)-like protein
MRFGVILSSTALSDAQRWQLVSSLYNQIQSMVEGTAALLITLAICASYTGWRGFWALAGTTVLVTSLRLAHWRRFVRARRDVRRAARTPEAWACDYTVGICTMATLWACVVVSVTFLFRDMQLLSLVLLLQSGWLAGAGVRNAASPSAVLGQTLITVVPTVICTLFGTNSLVRLLSPACLAYAFVLLSLARFYGNQLLSLLESEQRLEVANEELQKLSCTDGLTGIANRRAFDSRLAASWACAVRQRLEIAIVMIDVDYFKLYNDCHGHLAGDECLRSIARHVAAAVLRGSDLAARYGGEEFVILLPGNGKTGATEVAERVRKTVYDANIPHDASCLSRVTISVGVASIAPGLQDNPASLITMADRALYKAKQHGRNHVSVATPTPLSYNIVNTSSY